MTTGGIAVDTQAQHGPALAMTKNGRMPAARPASRAVLRPHKDLIAVSQKRVKDPALRRPQPPYFFPVTQASYSARGMNRSEALLIQ